MHKYSLIFSSRLSCVNLKFPNLYVKFYRELKFEVEFTVGDTCEMTFAQVLRKNNVALTVCVVCDRFTNKSSITQGIILLGINSSSIIGKSYKADN